MFHRLELSLDRPLRRYELFVSVGDLHEAREDPKHAKKLLEAFLKAAAARQQHLKSGTDGQKDNNSGLGVTEGCS